MSNWYTRPPIDVPENAQKPQTVIYGPRGESLVQKVPRSVGFRPPNPKPKIPTPRENA